MPGLKDLLKKKDRINEDSHAVPEFTFIRSTTESDEIIQPPTHPDDNPPIPSSKDKRRTLGFRSNSSATASTTRELPPAAQHSSQLLPKRSRGERRLSERLHLPRRDRSGSESVESSSNLPADLPVAPAAVAATARVKDNAAAVDVDDAAVKASREQQEQREAQWEKRATILAMSSPLRETQAQVEPPPGPSRSRSVNISDVTGDVNIQEAIRLHEEGDLKKSTDMFGTLADPNGANNALSQVLYGLALRHGWGIPVNADEAIHYLSLAASNSASIEEQALSSGLKKGGSAKGELVLAIFELANCFRNGWGVKKDSVAARQYYETAANLGDTDAMEQAAWCYLEGIGGSKDKVRPYPRRPVPSPPIHPT